MYTMDLELRQFHWMMSDYDRGLNLRKKGQNTNLKLYVLRILCWEITWIKSIMCVTSHLRR